MSNVPKLKKEAAELEAKKQFDKALKVYAKLFEEFERHPQEVDVTFYNRVGDLQIKLGNTTEGVDAYEKAVDHYADGGFFNNAIAMCNKILRTSPGRSTVYYKLGKVSAQKGFKAEARQNFLEYADRMEKSGNTAEAFRALAEFVSLLPDQEDVQSMLADQLAKAGQKKEALEQLQALYERVSGSGRSAEADALAARMRVIDPSVEVRVGTDTHTASAGPSGGSDTHPSSGPDLIFIDLDDTPKKRASAPPPPPPPAAAPPPPPPPPPVAAAPPPAPPPIAAAPPPPPPPPLAAAPPPPEPVADFEITRASDIGETATPSMAGGALEIESTNLGGADVSTPAAGEMLVEPTSFGELTLDAAPPAPLGGANAPAAPDFMDLSLDTPKIEEPAAATDDLMFVMPEAPAAETPPPLKRDSKVAAKPAEPDLLDFGETELPPTAIAPVIGQKSEDAKRDSLAFLDIDLAEEIPGVKPKEAAPPPAATRPPASSRPSTAIPTPQRPSTSMPPAATPPRPSTTGVSRPSMPAAPRASVPAASPPTARTSTPSAPATQEPARKSAVFAAKAVHLLAAAVQGAPENWPLRREWAEAMIEAGDRTAGIEELERAMTGAENFDDLELAMGIAEELGKLEPLTVKHHQKRVEYAFRRNDRPRLVEAYLTLADALMQNDQSEKARAVYQRVLDLAPDNMQAQAAVETIAPPPAAPAAPRPTTGAIPAAPRASSTTKPPRASTGPGATKQSPPAAPPKPAAAEDAGGFNLGDWLRDDEAPKDTRMVVDEKEPTGDENADFADMLKKFKQGVADNVDAEDYQSHYDLAIAFKEMGLLDEAIAGFQKALGAKKNRLPTYEALGECFLEKGQAKMASAILGRALSEDHAGDEQLVGVLYLLGRAAEAQDQPSQALDYYGRVFVIDIQFRDVADRMSAIEKVSR